MCLWVKGHSNVLSNTIWLLPNLYSDWILRGKSMLLNNSHEIASYKYIGLKLPTLHTLQRQMISPTCFDAHWWCIVRLNEIRVRRELCVCNHVQNNSGTLWTRAISCRNHSSYFGYHGDRHDLVCTVHDSISIGMQRIHPTLSCFDAYHQGYEENLLLRIEKL